MNGLEYDV